MRRAGELDPERWRRIREIFEAALEAGEAARAGLLTERCGADSALRNEVLDLLEAEARLELEATASGGASGARFLESSLTSVASLLGAGNVTAEAPDLELPFRWGPLEVLEPIGAGSFGRVYRAHDPSLRRDVALKLRPVDLSGRTADGEGHLEEARRLARVRHPNVLVVHGAEIHDGVAGIWTDLVPGETLDRLLHQSGPFARESLLRVGVDLCRALEAVHGASLVHGDVKPSNAMRDADGRILLMDFGSGQSAGGSGDEEWGESAGGRFLQGTPVAMAPELWSGAAPSAASDLYAMGVLLYRLASGQYPFRASELRELEAALRAQERIPLDELRPDLPSAFARVVHRALAPDPRDRPSSAAELQWLLAASLGAEEVDDRSSAAEPEAAHLPRFTTRFVGRAAELRQLRSLLTEPGLVSIVGSGGCGKSRLAVHLAAELHPHLPGGAVWVGLASLSGSGRVAAAAARTAGLSDQAGLSSEEALAEWIGARPLLLVLDNAEHVLDEVTRLASWLLGACPRLHLLVTSRQRLSVHGERTFRLNPMSVPVERSVPDGLEILECDSVRLFIDRAQRTGEDLRLTAASAQEVARIVRRVEGIPLAVELAAARVSTLGLAVVAGKLDESFRLLADRKRPEGERHSTLLASITWSYDLLSPGEARLLARLAVFSGGCALAGAEAVCADAGPEPFALGGTEVVDLLAALVESSLVSVGTVGNDEPRYRLLEMVRVFAAERLEAGGEAEEVHERHLAWIEQATKEHSRALHGPLMQEHMDWFDREHGNIRGALQRLRRLAASDAVAADRLVDLCLFVRLYWFPRGHLREGLEHFRLALLPTSTGTRLRSLGLGALAHFHLALGDTDVALERAEESVALARISDHQVALGNALVLLGSLHTDSARYEQARACLEEALTIPAPSGRAARSRAILCNLGVLEASIGDFAAAQVWYERALEGARADHDESAIGLLTANLAHTALKRGQGEKAREFAQESVRTMRRTSNFTSLWSGLCAMAEVEMQGGRLPEARAYLLEALSSLGPDPHVKAWIGVLDSTVDLLLARGQSEAAAEILGAIDAAREHTRNLTSVGLRSDWEQRRERLREALGTDRFGSAWARGRGRSMADAMEFAQQIL